ncbi:unnamed protein product, partial [Vitis vinifera]
MLTQQKPFMRALRRSITSSPSSSSNSSSPSSSSSSSWIHLRTVLLVVASSSPVSTDRGTLKSPWSRRRRKHALLAKQWKSLFTPDGKFTDGGVKFLKKVRSGGVDPSIRVEVWPFLLGVYDVKSSREERDSIRAQKRKEYENLRKQCRRILKQSDTSIKLRETTGSCSNQDSEEFSQVLDSSGSEDVVSARLSHSTEGGTPEEEDSVHPSGLTCEDASANFATWQRIIRLDAVRANAEWIIYSPSQAAVSEIKARRFAESVGLKDYDHLEPCRIFHAARLVAILEAYALYDSEIGYCQGMSDLLSPIISVMEEDHDAFWCFVGYMKKARHNFRLDEVGIRRQLSIVSKIIKLQRKLIIEKYSSMDEIIRECNSMAGHLDVWKLLDDAHDLVVTLHDKV